VGNYAYPAPGLSRPHGVVRIDGDTARATFTYDVERDDVLRIVIPLQAFAGA